LPFLPWFLGLMHAGESGMNLAAIALPPSEPKMVEKSGRDERRMSRSTLTELGRCLTTRRYLLVKARPVRRQNGSGKNSPLGIFKPRII
jgi:hypothetical protein